MKTAQKDYLFERFCAEAKYIPNMLKPYSIWVNGKRLSSTETDDLFNQYQKEIAKQCQEEGSK